MIIEELSAAVGHWYLMRNINLSKVCLPFLIKSRGGGGGWRVGLLYYFLPVTTVRMSYLEVVGPAMTCQCTQKTNLKIVIFIIDSQWKVGWISSNNIGIL